MHFTKLVPNVFYENIHEALKLFVSCLHFEIVHDEINSENPFCVIEKNDLTLNIFENKLLANEHNSEFRFTTQKIEEVYDEISKHNPEFLHTNLSKITLRPWGAKEFAIKDKQLGIIIQQW